MLFNAARADHLRATIRPALARGAIVICDRFADSTRAYQGALGEVSSELVRAAEAAVVGDTKPDLTIILDLPAELTVKRLGARREVGGPDKFESEALAHHARLRQAYLNIAAESPERCVVVSARRSIDQVAERILRLVEALLDGESLKRRWPSPKTELTARPIRASAMASSAMREPSSPCSRRCARAVSPMLG
jgi:dTMP kinase